jgi:WD40 repeat protein
VAEVRRYAVIAALILCAGSSAAFGQAGIVRSQTDRITGAVQNQIRQAVRPQLRIRNPAGPVTSLALSADGRLLAIVHSSNSVRIWDLQNGVEQARYNTPDRPRALRISGDGERVVLGTETGNLIVLAAANGATITTMRAHQGPVLAIDVSRDGNVIASAGNDGMVQLWDGRTGRQIASVRAPASIGSLALAPDGQRLVAGSSNGGTVIVWNGGLGAAPGQLNSPSPGIVTVGFGNAGRIVAMGSDGVIHSWEANATAAPSRSFRALGQTRSAQLSQDGRAAAVADADAHSQVIDLESGRVLREFTSTPGSSRFALVDLNQRRLITGGNDGIVRIWNLNSGANIAQIISTANGWAALDGQGRFDGTPDGVQDVQWLAAQLNLPIENFSKTYLEPGLVAKSMRDQSNYVAPAPSSVEAGIFLPPRATVAVAPGSYSGGSLADVTVTAQDQGGGVGMLRLFHNGKLVPTERQTGERRDNQNVVRSYRVPLVAGGNRFEAVGSNQQQIDGEPGRADVTAAGQPALPALHIVTIGVNRYRDSRFNLDYGVPDALAILRQLDRASSGLFNRAVAYQLTDEAATRAKILEVLTALQSLPPDDVLVVYLAGHGEIVGNEWYLLPQDFVFSPQGIQQTGISSTQLQQLLSRAGPQRVFVMIDSCKSGGGIDTLATSMDRRVLHAVGHDTGVALLASARRDQLAAEIPRLGHGAFTYVVLEGLSGKAATRGGRVTAGDILSYSTSQLPSLTKSQANFMQIPVAYRRGEDFSIAR